ncbi:MAG: tetratricopeptide repeat protein [Desulfobacterales bacterium]|nr:tetratricopeptide repeat protein [Desulfobacterales bacterium]
MARVKLARKKELKQPDEFISLSTRMINYALKYKVQFSYVVAGIFSIVIIASLLTYYFQKREKTALELLGKIESKLQGKDPQVKELDKEVEEQLDTLVNQYGGTQAGKFGTFKYATVCYQHGKYDQSITYFKKALDAFYGDPLLEPIILNSLGYAFEMKKDYVTAMDYFDQVTKGDSNLVKDEAMFHMGLIYKITEKPDKQKEIFNKLIADFSTSLFADIARDYVYQVN